MSGAAVPAPPSPADDRAAQIQQRADQQAARAVELDFHAELASPRAGSRLARSAEAARRAASLHADAARTIARLDAKVHAATRTDGDRSIVSIGYRDPGSVGRVRRRTGKVLRSWGASSGQIDSGVLLVSELVSNAVRHAGTSGVVLLARHDHTVRISVHDRSPLPPFLGDGLGMHLVARLAASWGAQPSPLGKVVWVELTLS